MLYSTRISPKWVRKVNDKLMTENSKILLVVDDDPGIRSQLRWALDQYEVITAENRICALEQIMAHRPRVVTLDLGLPPDAEGTREGFETLQAIMQQAPDTCVVVISGAMDNINAARARASGAFECYTKPVNIDKLRDTVDQAYQSRNNGEAGKARGKRL